MESEPKDKAVAESEKNKAKRGQTKEDDIKTATKKRERRQRLASDGSQDSNDSGENYISEERVEANSGHKKRRS